MVGGRACHVSIFSPGLICKNVAFFFRKFAGRKREVSVGRCVGIEWKGGERGQSGCGMVKPRCKNAGEGCPSWSRLKTKEDWEFCAKCLKRGQGKIMTIGKGGRRWTVRCVNANSAVGQLLGCSGSARTEREGEEGKKCAECFRRRNGAQTEKQAKRALMERERRKRIKEESESRMPVSVDLHVITVRSNFARLTFHGRKKTHVELNGILCGRAGECVALRVSKSKSKTGFEEHVDGGAGEEENECNEEKNCGCCERGHIVGIVRLGETRKVCKRKSHEDEWTRKTCCKMNAAHIFVTELTAIEQLKEPYAFANGNLVPVVGSIPTCRLPAGMVEECVKSAEILSKRIAERERAKASGERRQSTKAEGVAFCGRVGVRQNCERCAP